MNHVLCGDVFVQVSHYLVFYEKYSAQMVCKDWHQQLNRMEYWQLLHKQYLAGEMLQLKQSKNPDEITYQKLYKLKYDYFMNCPSQDLLISKYYTNIFAAEFPDLHHHYGMSLQGALNHFFKHVSSIMFRVTPVLRYLYYLFVRLEQEQFANAEQCKAELVQSLVPFIPNVSWNAFQVDPADRSGIHYVIQCKHEALLHMCIPQFVKSMPKHFDGTCLTKFPLQSAIQYKCPLSHLQYLKASGICKRKYFTCHADDSSEQMHPFNVRYTIGMNLNKSPRWVSCRSLFNEDPYCDQVQLFLKIAANHAVY